MTFGEKLLSLRKRNGISQEELANHLNVSRQAISKWETGAIPDVNNILKVASFFDCSLDYLLNDSCENCFSQKERNLEDNRENKERPPEYMKEKQKLNIIILCRYLGFFVFLIICFMLVLSKIFPAPLFRQNIRTGNWRVGISAFIEYHGLQGFAQVMFILLIVCVLAIAISTGVKIWPDRRKMGKKKQFICLSIGTGLILLGIGFLFYRFFFLDVLLWNIGLTVASFLYFCLLSASMMLYQKYEKQSKEGEESEQLGMIFK